MTFHLDLAIAHACALVVLYWLASWLLPALAHALAALLRGCCRNPESPHGRGRPHACSPHDAPEVRVRLDAIRSMRACEGGGPR